MAVYIRSAAWVKCSWVSGSIPVSARTRKSSTSRASDSSICVSRLWRSITSFTAPAINRVAPLSNNMPIKSRAGIDNLVPEPLRDLALGAGVGLVLGVIVLVPAVVITVVGVVVSVVLVSHVARGSGSYWMARWGRRRLSGGFW